MAEDLKKHTDGCIADEGSTGGNVSDDGSTVGNVVAGKGTDEGSTRGNGIAGNVTDEGGTGGNGTHRNGKEKSKKEKARYGAYIALIILGAIAALVALFYGIGALFNILAPVVVGAVFAYILNPLVHFLETKPFRQFPEKLANVLATVLAVIFALAIVLFLLLAVVPQLIESIREMIDSISSYQAQISDFFDWLTSATKVDFSQMNNWLADFSENIPQWLHDNISQLLEFSKSAGDRILTVTMGFVLSIYFLLDKARILAGAQRFFHAVLPENKFDSFSHDVKRTHSILTRYIIAQLVDALIVGTACAILMLIGRMPFVALISSVMAIVNLIPTFGPVIGSAIGVFFLLLNDPMKALIFLIVMAIIHAVDGYILKPKLFGSALGVSPVLVLASVIIGGRIFGVWGMLLAIPVAAIVSFLIEDLVTYLEKKKQSL